MLIEFSVGNYRSFRDVVTFSMVAVNKKARDEEVNLNSIFKYKDGNLLKSAVIYGANASGKSNFLKAFRFFKSFIRNSSNPNPSGKINLTPYTLNNFSSDKPSYFEVIFVYESIRYRYGFEADKQKIHKEWLFRKNLLSKKPREYELFWRKGQNIEFKPAFKEGKKYVDATRKDALFLSVVSQWNGKISSSVTDWFRTVHSISGIQDGRYFGVTVDLFQNKPEFNKSITEFMNKMDLGISGIKAREEDVEIPELIKALIEGSDDAPDELKDAIRDADGRITNQVVNFTHPVFDKHGKKVGNVDFDFDSQESEGTQKAFKLSGLILVTLAGGGILFVDELDARLHPRMTKAIVKLFNSKEDNPNNAQLIFATHDTTILDNTVFRRDQVWFAEKDEYGNSDLYSLSDYKDVRNDSMFGKDYLAGKYGAVPYIGTFQF